MRIITSSEGCKLSAEEIMVSLSTDPMNGLSQHDVQLRKDEFGANAFEEEEDEPLYAKILDKVRTGIYLYIMVDFSRLRISSSGAPQTEPPPHHTFSSHALCPPHSSRIP
jgi:hypothetical protein